jgi:hypothetical protein
MKNAVQPSAIFLFNYLIIPSLSQKGKGRPSLVRLILRLGLREAKICAWLRRLVELRLSKLTLHLLLLHLSELIDAWLLNHRLETHILGLAGQVNRLLL